MSINDTHDDDCFYFFPSDRLCSTPKAFRHRHQWDQSKRPSTQIKNKYEITIIRGGQMERFGEGDEEVMRGRFFSFSFFLSLCHFLSFFLFLFLGGAEEEKRGRKGEEDRRRSRFSFSPSQGWFVSAFPGVFDLSQSLDQDLLDLKASCWSVLSEVCHSSLDHALNESLLHVLHCWFSVCVLTGR